MFFRSIPGIGPVASTMLIAEMPELGTITGEQAAALTGLAPVAHDSGTLRGKRAIAGGRRALRHVMFQAALVAAHHNAVLKAFADRLRKAGKPHKVVITAVARKASSPIANALCKSRQKWTPRDGLRDRQLLAPPGVQPPLQPDEDEDLDCAHHRDEMIASAIISADLNRRKA